MNPSPVLTPTTARVQQLKGKLRRLDRRSWSLWATATTVMFFLWLVAFAFSVSGLPRDEQRASGEQVTIAVRSLLALVLLFIVFVFYQQRLIVRLREKLHAQMAATIELNARADTFDRLSVLDELTGLFNRRFALEHLAREIGRCDLGAMSLVVVLIDLDEFASINDIHGRTVGDVVLQTFGHHIRKAIRSADLPVRLGDDKFLVILSGCGVDEVHRPLLRLRGCEVQYGGTTIPIAFSAGWVSSRPGELAGELLSRAEETLCQQKYARSVLYTS
jgi:diguanylate cyclase